MSQCSLRRVALEYGDYLAYRKLVRFFDLSGEQKKWLENKTDSIWKHLKENEFVPMAQTFEEVARRWELGFTTGDLIWIATKYRGFRIKFFDLIADDAGSLISQLNAEQKKHIGEEFDEMLEKPKENLERSDDDRNKKARERYEENLKYWFGHASKEQVTAVYDIYAPSKADLERRFEYQKISYKNFLNLVATNTSAAEIAKTIRLWSQKPYVMRGEKPDDEKVFVQRATKLMLTLNQIVDPEQRAHAAKKFRDMAKDLRAKAH